MQWSCPSDLPERRPDLDGEDLLLAAHRLDRAATANEANFTPAERRRLLCIEWQHTHLGMFEEEG